MILTRVLQISDKAKLKLMPKKYNNLCMYDC